MQVNGEAAPSEQRSARLPDSLQRNSRIPVPDYNCTDTTFVKLVMDYTSYQYFSRTAFPSSAPSFFKDPDLILIKQRAAALLVLTWGSRIHLHKNALKSMDVLLYCIPGSSPEL